MTTRYFFIDYMFVLCLDFIFYKVKLIDMIARYGVFVDTIIDCLNVAFRLKSETDFYNNFVERYNSSFLKRSKR